MPNIQPFSGYRYNPGRVGLLSDVVSPPYDVIDDKMQNELYAKHPNNVVRLILNKQDPANDTESNNRYTRSAALVKEWKEDGVLVKEAHAAIYVYHQVYTIGGKEYVRKGFMCRCEAVPFGQGMVFPHEITMSGPKLDRLMLTTACKMNFSQIFGLYPDETNKTQQILEDAIANSNEPPLEATDNLGVISRMWIITDPVVIAEVVKEMGQKPIFVADGHHRYETACNYRKQLAESGELTEDHPANYVLMVCIAMDDPGLIVLPTHRIFPALPEMSSEELTEKLANCFTVEPAGDGPEAAFEAWEKIEASGRQDMIALYTVKDKKWVIATLSNIGREKMDEVAAEHHPEWRELGVGILHALVIGELIGQKEPKKPTYVHLVEEVVSELKEHPEQYTLAALVMPATVDHIRTLSMLGERMPAKSTYFYPKLLTGMVFNPLD